MSKNPFDTLGISRPTSLGKISSEKLEEAKKAFRKMSMLHHPDRDGGTEEKFKEIKAAWEEIEKINKNGFSKPSHAGFSNSYNKTHFYEYAPPTEITISVSLSDAYYGFSIPLFANGKHDIVNIKRNAPIFMRAMYTTESGASIIITITLDDKFKQKNPPGTLVSGSNGLVSAVGDLLITISVDAIDIIMGTWIQVDDFLNESFQVRIPQGFNPQHFLKVAGRGYYNWNLAKSVNEDERADLYITVIPVFSKPNKIGKNKLNAFIEMANLE